MSQWLIERTLQHNDKVVKKSRRFTLPKNLQKWKIMKLKKNQIKRKKEEEMSTKYKTIKRWFKLAQDHYSENWLRFVVSVVVFVWAVVYLLTCLVALIEQLGRTVVSIYKWQVLAQFINPHNKTNNLFFDFASLLPKLLNVSTWFQLIRGFITG